MQKTHAAQDLRKHNRDPRTLAKSLRTYLNSLGIELGHGHALEAIARLQELPSYDALSAALRKPAEEARTPQAPPQLGVEELLNTLTELDFEEEPQRLIRQVQELAERARGLQQFAAEPARPAKPAATIALSKQQASVVGVEMNMTLRDRGLSIEYAEAFNQVFRGIFGEDHESMAWRRPKPQAETASPDEIRTALDEFDEEDRTQTASAAGVTVEIRYDRSLDDRYAHMEVRVESEDGDVQSSSGVCMALPRRTFKEFTQNYAIKVLKFVVRSLDFEVGATLQDIEFKGLTALRNHGYDDPQALRQVEALAGFAPPQKVTRNVRDY